MLWGQWIVGKCRSAWNRSSVPIHFSASIKVWRTVNSGFVLKSTELSLHLNTRQLAIATSLDDTDSVNFLAHLVLAPQTPAGLIGSIAPDMIRGPLPDDLDLAVLASAKEHRHIDRATDAHQAFGRTRDRLTAVVGSRLSGVLADVLYDHVLATDWARWRSDEFGRYLAQTEKALMTAIDLVPKQMQSIVRKMIDEQWLASYASASGLRARLDTMSCRLSKRVGRPMSLMISEQHLADLYQPIADDFEQLWPDLISHVQKCRADDRHRLAS